MNACLAGRTIAYLELWREVIAYTVMTKSTWQNVNIALYGLNDLPV